MAQIFSLERARIPYCALVSQSFIDSYNDMIYPDLTYGSFQPCDFNDIDTSLWKSSNLVILNTYSNLPYSILDSIPDELTVFVYIHNLNGFLPYVGVPQLTKSILAAFFAIKGFSFHLYLRSLYRFILSYKAYTRFFQRNDIYLMVMHENMKKNIIQSTNMEDSKVKVSPFRVLDCNETPSSSEQALIHMTRFRRIVTIGNIDSSRRCFEDGFRLFSSLSKIGVMIEWHIVGKISNKKTQNLLSSLSKKYRFSPVFHGGSNRVTTPEAVNIIKNSDFLLPLHYRYLRFGCFLEEYSQTKASGIEYDSLFYQKHSILAEWYKPTALLEEFCISYSSISSLKAFLAGYYQSSTLPQDVPCPSSFATSNQLTQVLINSITPFIPTSNLTN